MKHYRDAFILIFAANLAATIGAGIQSCATLVAQPLTFALYMDAGALYLTSAALLSLAGRSIVAGWRKEPED